MDLFSKKSIYARNPILELDPLAEELWRRGKKIVKLNRGDPPRFFPTPRYIKEAYVRAIRSGKTYYSRAQGTTELVEAVAERYRRYGMRLESDDVIVTAGVSEALLFINNALINNGDCAVLFAPYYSQYIPRLRIEGGRPIIGNLEMEHDWRADIEGLEAKLKRDTARRRKIKYMMITNPHNPTGKVFSAGELKLLVGLANEHDILIISDEIYDEIVYNGSSFTSVGQVARGVPHLILNGSSKNFDSTGFRIGFMIVQGRDKVSEGLKRVFSNYALVRLSLNTPAEAAVAEAIRNKREHEREMGRMVGKISRRVNFAVDLLMENQYLEVARPSGAFYILPKVDMRALGFRDSRDFVRSVLLETGVQLTGGYWFGAPSHFRIVALPPEETLEYAIGKIGRFCKRHARER